MAETDMTARRAYRLPPCPAWDVEGMERWLEDMAERGFFLILPMNAASTAFISGSFVV